MGRVVAQWLRSVSWNHSALSAESEKSEKMKLITLVLCVSFAIPAFARKHGKMRSYPHGGGKTHYTNNHGGGGGNCFSHVSGNLPPARGTYNNLDPRQLTPGTVLHLKNYNWNGSYSPIGQHWVRVESVDGNGNVTISQTNFNGNAGVSYQTLPASSFRGTVTIHQ